MDHSSNGESAAAAAGTESSSLPALTNGDAPSSPAFKEGLVSASTTLGSTSTNTSDRAPGLTIYSKPRDMQTLSDTDDSNSCSVINRVCGNTGGVAASSPPSPTAAGPSSSCPAGAHDTSTAPTINSSSVDLGEIPPAVGVPTPTENDAAVVSPASSGAVLPSPSSDEPVTFTSDMMVLEDQNGDGGGAREVNGLEAVTATRPRSSKRQGGRGGGANAGNKRNWRPVRVGGNFFGFLHLISF